MALHQAGTSCVIEYCAETEVWTGTAGGTAAIQSLAGSTMGSNFLSPTPPWFQDPLGLNDRACNQSKENPAPPPPPVRVLPGFAALGACTRTIGLPCTLLSTHISTSSKHPGMLCAIYTNQFLLHPAHVLPLRQPIHSIHVGVWRQFRCRSQSSMTCSALDYCAQPRDIHTCSYRLVQSCL